MLYTTWGPVRGCCGHAHRTLQAAYECFCADVNGCATQGGYSDRDIHRIEDRDELRNFDVTQGPGEPIDDRERWEATGLWSPDDNAEGEAD